MSALRLKDKQTFEPFAHVWKSVTKMLLLKNPG